MAGHAPGSAVTWGCTSKLLHGWVLPIGDQLCCKQYHPLSTILQLAFLTRHYVLKIDLMALHPLQAFWPTESFRARARNARCPEPMPHPGPWDCGRDHGFWGSVGPCRGGFELPQLRPLSGVRWRVPQRCRPRGESWGSSGESLGFTGRVWAGGQSICWT